MPLAAENNIRRCQKVYLRAMIILHPLDKYVSDWVQYRSAIHSANSFKEEEQCDIQDC